MITNETSLHQIGKSSGWVHVLYVQIFDFFYHQELFSIKTRRCRMVANGTTLHKRQHETDINNYR